MIDRLTIDSQGVSFFDITADGHEFILARETDGGAWHLSWEKGNHSVWIGLGGIRWMDALARALRQIDKHLNALAA